MRNTSHWFVILSVLLCLAACDKQKTPPASIVISRSDQAVTAAQRKFPELAQINPSPSGAIGASTDVVTQTRTGGWNLIFVQGWGDCPSGCINHHYWYVTVEMAGDATLAGEYVVEYDSSSNKMRKTGSPKWGVP